MVKKNECCGCSACFNICPKTCISMSADAEGFLYPVIDKSMCIDCGLCSKVCPAENSLVSDGTRKVYACKNKDTMIQQKSSSGGVFSLLAEYIINSGGVVFGAAFDDDFHVVHSYVDSINDLYKFRGSKYVQSQIGNTYNDVKRFLKEDRLVLFSGTSCQIAGLKHFLRKDYTNLLCIDVICHGVPSPMVWEKYLSEQKRKYGDNIHSINFRDKTHGWTEFSMHINFDNRDYCRKLTDDEYLRGFIHNIFLRPSCYSCKYKSFKCGSDLSIADFWGIKYVIPDFYDNKGVSMVFINSVFGENIFNDITESLIYKEVALQQAIKCNKAVEESPRYNKRRRKFYRKFTQNRDNVITWINRCLESSFINKINIKIFNYLKRKA